MKRSIFVLIISFIALSTNAMNLQCSTPRENIVIKLENNNLKFDGRFPAETVVQRTKLRGKSLSKIFFIAGDKHTLHIENTNAFNEFNDYINIKSRQGHEMTYPMNCMKI